MRRLHEFNKGLWQLSILLVIYLQLPFCGIPSIISHSDFKFCRLSRSRNDSTMVCSHFWSSNTITTLDDIGEREIDFFQNRDLDLILTERATRFYDPKLSGIEKEKCILVAVDTKLETRRAHVESAPIFSLKESLRCVWRKTRNVINQIIECSLYITATHTI